MKAVILLLLSYKTVLGSCNSADKSTMDMMVSFVKYEEKPTGILIPHLCWKLDEIKALSRKLSDAGVSVSQSLQMGVAEESFHQLLIVADLSCPGVSEFLGKANEDGYFNAPFRWLLFADECGSQELMEPLNIFVNSDVVLIWKRGDHWVFTEVYRISKNSELIYSTRLIWRPNDFPNSDINTVLTSKEDLHKDLNKTEDSIYTNVTELNKSTEGKKNDDITALGLDKNIVTVTKTKFGVIEDYRETKVLSARRRDLRGHVLTVANVLAESNDTIHHLDDRLQLHHDSITKMSYIAVKICFEMLNATERRMFASTWGYRDKSGNWNGIIDLLNKKEADLGTKGIKVTPNQV